MFKSAATKIAHNSTIPSLSGNKDLRPLQDLINAEKAVLISLQKLSVDFSKASEAIRNWGLSEGDDLGDTLSASTTILNHFASALTIYASHGHAIREHLKAIRTREENLSELKSRRRNVSKKAEDADRKLSKMSPEHKNFHLQSETLTKLRDEIRAMDTDIMVEEAALGDFKRTESKSFMGLKFGGLTECCEKGLIIGDFGRMIIAEIPEEQTQPGFNRSLYQGHPHTESLVVEVLRSVSGVELSTIPTAGPRDRRQYPNLSGRPSDGGFPGSPGLFTGSKPTPQPPRDSSEYPLPGRPYSNDTPPSSVLERPYPWTSAADQPNTPSHSSEPHAMDDFGVNSRSSGDPMFDAEAAGSRFATVPLNGRHGGSSSYSLQDPSRHEEEPSFASSVQVALDHKDPHSQPGAHLQTALSPPQTRRPLPPSNLGNPWDEPKPAGHGQKPTISDNDDALLAYMTSADDDDYDESPHRHSTFQIPKGAAPPATFDDSSRFSRHVKFGHVTDVDEELENRASAERQRRSEDQAPRYSGLSDRPPTLPTLPLTSFEHDDDYFDEKPKPNDHVHESSIDETPTPVPESAGVRPTKLSPDEEEKKLNAAAAQRITLELEAMNANPPDYQRRPSMEAIAQRDRDLDSLSLGESHEQSKESYSPLPSPLMPPSAPFAHRSVSPHPYSDLGNGVPSPSSYGQPQPSPLSSPFDNASHGPPTPYSPHSQLAHPMPQTPPLSITPRLHGPASPTYDRQENPLPPRFQTSPKPSFHTAARFQPGASPLSTPLSEIRTPGLAINKSASSLALASPGGAGRTISAAAFKRPRNLSGDVTPGGSPGLTPKSLPSLSQPGSRSVSTSGASPFPPSPSLHSTGLPPQEANRVSHAGSDYDYIDAYMDNSAPPSPSKHEPAHDYGTHPQNAPPGGYGAGKYATQLDDGTLR